MKWQPTPLLLPGQSHGQRSLESYSPWGGKDLDVTEQACMHGIIGHHAICFFGIYISSLVMCPDLVLIFNLVV